MNACHFPVAILAAFALLLGPGCPSARTPPVTPAAAAPAAPQLSLTGAATMLTRVTSDPVDEERPILSPDGRSLILYASTREVVNGQYTGNIAQKTVVGVNPQNGAQRTIYTSAQVWSYSPDWMPNGNIVFVSNAMGRFNLVKTLTRSPSAAVSVIVDGATAPGIGNPRVSPDGKKVAFEITPSGSATMVAMCNINGSELTMLGEGSQPAFTPDGKSLLFARAVGQAWQIFGIDVETGGGLVQITHDAVFDVAPNVSPDGRYVVFASTRGRDQIAGATTNTYNLFAVHLDGTGLTQLTRGGAMSTEPYWASDGFIYFTSNPDGNFDIWKLKPILETAPPPAPN
jgi:TolB protein